MAATASPAGEGTLQPNAVGLVPVLFQSITHMAPAAAVAFSITVGVTYAGGSIPLAVLLALVACLMVAISIGQLARHLPSAGGLYTYSARALGPTVGFLVQLIKGTSLAAIVGFIELARAGQIISNQT